MVFSVVPRPRVPLAQSPRGRRGVNHDSSVRPRRQDREPEYRETGAFYVMRTDGFARRGHRFFGRIGSQRVPDAHAIEIDTPTTWRSHGRSRRSATTCPGARIDVDALVTDFDGVHTDDPRA